MFGTPKNSNTEQRLIPSSGDVSEVESGLEVTESETDDELSKELVDSFNSFISDKRNTCTKSGATRALKKALIPGYGKKGMGWIKNPKKAMHNKIYNKTTLGIKDLLK